jgi:hypothetical protein
MEDPSRYALVDLYTASAPNPLRVHVVDAGEGQGFRLVGLERPDSPRPR